MRTELRFLLPKILFVAVAFSNNVMDAWLIKASFRKRICLPSSSSSSSSLRSILFATTSVSSTKSIINSNRHPNKIIDIQQHVGSGSYGTVYTCQYTDSQGNLQTGIAKRAWTLEELVLRHYMNNNNDNSNNSNGLISNNKQQLAEKVKRAEYYLYVEQHCLTQIQSRINNNSNNNKPIIMVPTLIGRFKDSKNMHEWIVMDLITAAPVTENTTNAMNSNHLLPTNTSSPTHLVAKSLKQVMDKDWIEQHSSKHKNPLSQIQKEFPLSNNATFHDILDKILLELLSCIQMIHSLNIVHRDVKPENLLIDGSNQRLVLIDFGSAADLEPTSMNPFGWKKRIGFDDDSIVALSPIYSAPEQFIKLDRNPLHYDVFSIAMIFFQLLFNLLDERTDAAFRQQLIESNYDLDTWLARELSSTIRPIGLDNALTYLDERKGLWDLLQRMIRPNPMDRISSGEAYKKFNDILTYDTKDRSDGNFLGVIRSSMESCTVSEVSLLDHIEPTTSRSRPLVFVASFDRCEPLGLLLSEALDKNDSPEFCENISAWKIATEHTSPGDVFVQDLVDNGQASLMGIFQIGDRVRAVGDIPVVGIGFEGFLRVLESYPISTETVTIQFDRKMSPPKDERFIQSDKYIRLIGHGAWSSKGRRISQEDAFVLHEIFHTDGSPKVLLAGVFDGHGGAAAAQTASQLLPSFFVTELEDFPIEESLVSAWNKTCEAYRERCISLDSCIAEYDPLEGIILAENGSKDLVSGTTASIVAIDYRSDEISILNCGDSRTIIFTEIPEKSITSFYPPSNVHFTTRDHKPSDDEEIRRLREGKDRGLDYSEPECSMSRYWLTVGDYQYAVSRSLEGTMATTKGIVSDADTTTMNLSQMVTDGVKNGAIVIGSDGLFDVMSNQEVARQILKMMKSGTPADSAAKELYHIALKKGSTDNISIIVTYFSV